MTFIQPSTVGTGAASPVNTVFSSSPVGGNLIVLGAYEAGSAGAATAATNTNALSLFDSYNSSGVNWTYVFSKTFGGTDNATFTITDAPATAIRTDAMEWSGLTTTLDDTVKHSTTLSTTSQALGSITTTVANSVIFVYCGFSAANGGSVTLPGFTILSTNGRYASAYQIVSTPQTISPTISWFAACRPTAIMFAFKPTSTKLPVLLNNYQFVTAGNGMSVSEKIR